MCTFVSVVYALRSSKIEEEEEEEEETGQFRGPLAPRAL